MPSNFPFAPNGALVEIGDSMVAPWRRISSIYGHMRELELANKLEDGLVTVPIDRVRTRIGLVAVFWIECHEVASRNLAEIVTSFSNLELMATNLHYLEARITESLSDLQDFCQTTFTRSKELEASVKDLREHSSIAKQRLADAGELTKSWGRQTSASKAINDLQQSVRELDDGARSIVHELDRVLHKIEKCKRAVQASNRDLEISFGMLENLVANICSGYELHPDTDIGRACSKRFQS